MALMRGSFVTRGPVAAGLSVGRVGKRNTGKRGQILRPACAKPWHNFRMLTRTPPLAPRSGESHSRTLLQFILVLARTSTFAVGLIRGSGAA